MKRTTQTGQGDQIMKTKLFLPIRKVDEEQRLVYGVITEETLDKAGEVLDYAGSKPLFEKWSNGIASATEGKSYGNVRVMHTNKVAGILNQELVFDDEAKTIEACAKVIDDAEWALVQAGAYTGFSIGGRYAKRWEQDGQKRFIAEPVEVSLVDNPCVPTATFSLVKADGVEEEVPFQLWSPSNEDVAKAATDLAKAAGDESTWVDHLEAAREQLLKAHADEADEDTDDEDADKGDGTSGEETADKTESTDDDESDDDKDKKAAKTDDDQEGDDDDAEASKSAGDEIEQVWKTSDGRTFKKKADAAAHQASVSTSDPLSKALASLRAEIDGADSTEVDPQVALITTTGEEVAKWHDLLTKAHSMFDEHCVAKGLYAVGRLAELMESLGYVCSSSCWERQSEGDDSPVPEMLANGLVQLGGALVTMAQEEVQEMIMEMQERGLDIDTIISTMPEMVENAAAIEMVKSEVADLAKVGSRHSKTDKERLKQVYRLLKELGVEDDDDKEKSEKLAKFDSTAAENERLQKVINDAVPAIEALKKDVAALKAQPMPPAGRTQVVTKGQEDGAKTDTGPVTLEKLIETHGADKLAEAAIKVAQRTPMSMVHRG